jgi:hypothetical protein
LYRLSLLFLNEYYGFIKPHRDSTCVVFYIEK